MKTSIGTILINRMLEAMPLIAMALIAAAAYYLVQINLRQAPRAPSPVLHEPDYTMHNFQARRFDASGTLRSITSGKRMDHFPDDDTAEVRMITSWARNERGLVTQMSAERALANGDGSELQLFGNARIWRDASKGNLPLDLKSEFLQIWLKEERAATHKPVTLTRGASVARAEKMAIQNIERSVSLEGRVSGVFVNEGKPQ
jgi:lipopolysaccharide export system protein LptC